jgi:tetratricopeptide (TPR) repeat protein
MIHTLLHPRRALSVLALAAGISASAQPLDGRLLQAQGDVRINGQAAQPAAALPAGALLSTGVDGRAQVRLADGSVIALAPASQVRLAPEGRQLALQRGGLALSTSADKPWQIDLPGRSIRSNGFLRLQDCAAGCAAQPGLYGRVSAGEAVLEYQGGRSVLRSRSFRWAGPADRPEVLAVPPELLDNPTSEAAAVRARGEVAQVLKAGLEHFNAGRDPEAIRALQQVRDVAPGEPIVPYYLGLIALRREETQNAINWLQQYVREDPDGAAQREVPKTLTLLSSAQLQQEVRAAVEREREVVSTPPEPGSIAVQAFVNQGDPNYRAMAKGLAAMIIADLSKVPGLKVLEREKVQLLVEEVKLGDSGLADRSSAVRSGRLMRAEKVVVGNFEVK